MYNRIKWWFMGMIIALLSQKIISEPNFCKIVWFSVNVLYEVHHFFDCPCPISLVNYVSGTPLIHTKHSCSQLIVLYFHTKEHMLLSSGDCYLSKMFLQMINDHRNYLWVFVWYLVVIYIPYSCALFHLKHAVINAWIVWVQYNTHVLKHDR